MMKCPTCGSQLEEHALFCHQCGASLKGHPASNEVVPPKPAAPQSAETPAERLRGGISPTDDPEDALWEGGYSGKAMIGSWVGAVLLSIALLVLGGMAASGKPWMWTVVGCVIAALWVFLFGRLFYRKLNVTYELTSQRFTHKTGILSRTTDRIELIDMDDVTFRQGLIERFVGVGTITIMSSDTSHPKLLLLGIDNVKEIADVIDQARRRERRRRGLHIEAV